VNFDDMRQPGIGVNLRDPTRHRIREATPKIYPMSFSISGRRFGAATW